MRKVVAILMFLSVSSTLWADNYKILKMNTSSIKIGKRICKTGDVFSDKSVIYWAKEKQAFRAQNLKTKEIRLFVEPEFRSKGCKTIKDYYVKINHLSTRGGMLGLDDLAEEMPDTLYLWDEFKMESPYHLDENSYFYVSYKTPDDTITNRVLKTEKNYFLIRREDFYTDGISDAVTVSLHYVDKRWDEDSIVKDSLCVILIPDND